MKLVNSENLSFKKVDVTNFVEIEFKALSRN